MIHEVTCILCIINWKHFPYRILLLHGFVASLLAYYSSYVGRFFFFFFLINCCEMNGKVISSHSSDLMMGGVCFFLGATNIWNFWQMKFPCMTFLNKTHRALYQNTYISIIFILYWFCNSTINTIWSCKWYLRCLLLRVCLHLKKKKGWDNFVLVFEYQSLKKILKVLNLSIIVLMIPYYYILYDTK